MGWDRREVALLIKSANAPVIKTLLFAMFIAYPSGKGRLAERLSV